VSNRLAVARPARMNTGVDVDRAFLAHQPGRRVRAERAEVRAARLFAPFGAEQEMTAVGQKMRREMVHLLSRPVERRQRRRRAAVRRHLQEADLRVAGEDDHVVAIPRAVGPLERVADRVGRRTAAPRFDPFQLAVGEVSDRAAVTRPEGRRRAGGHVEADRLQGIE